MSIDRDALSFSRATLMYERFTSRSRDVIRAADRAAHQLESDRIDSEHVLLGIISERECVAAHVLVRLGIDFDKLKSEIENLAQPVAGAPSKLPQTLAAKQVIMLAMAESRALNHGYVGTEHLLLGLLGDATGRAGRMLSELGVTAREVGREVQEVLAHGPVPPNRFELPAITSRAPIDPILAAVVAAWPTLPEPIKAAILALIRAQ